MTSFGIAPLLDRQRIVAINGAGVEIPAFAVVIGYNQIKTNGRTILAVRQMESGEVFQHPQFIVGPEGLPANGYGAVFAGEVPVRALGSGSAGVPCGAQPGSFTLATGLPGFVWVDSQHVIRDAMGRTYWAKAQSDWVDDGGKTTNESYVTCKPATDHTGNDLYSETFRVFIPRGGRLCDPNVYSGNVIPYQIGLGSNGAPRAIALGCLDDAIKTVKPGTARQGWEEYTDLDGYFPVGWSKEDADFGTLGATGGSETHTHASIGVHGPEGTPPGHQSVPGANAKNHLPPYRNVAFIERVP